MHTTIHTHLRPLALAVCLLFALGQAQAALLTAGNTGADSEAGYNGNGYMRGYQVTLSEQGDLVSATVFAAAMDSTPIDMVFGLYSDSAGHPDQLLASTGVNTISGLSKTDYTSNFLTQPTLLAGDYWLLLSTSSSYIAGITSTPTNYISTAYSYTGSMPSDTSGFVPPYMASSTMTLYLTYATPAPEPTSGLLGVGLCGLLLGAGTRQRRRARRG